MRPAATYVNYTYVCVGVCVIFTRVNRSPTHKKSCGPYPEKKKLDAQDLRHSAAKSIST